MTAVTDLRASSTEGLPSRVKLVQRSDIRAILIFLAVIAGALFFLSCSIYSDIEGPGGGSPSTIVPFLLLGAAMLIALGLEFVNGFRNTANAVATVIFTHARQPQGAVRLGCRNLVAVLTSAGAGALGSVALLRVEPILQVGSSAAHAIVFALLISAIVWNLGSRRPRMSASTSRKLFGSIVGVGGRNAVPRGRDGAGDADWDQVHSAFTG